MDVGFVENPEPLVGKFAPQKGQADGAVCDIWNRNEDRATFAQEHLRRKQNA